MPEANMGYARTSDGVTIAYTVSGHGERTLLHTCNTFSAQLQFDAMPGRSEWIAALGERFSVVRYDSRGTGLSQRDCDDLGPDSLLLDLEAVMQACESEQVVLFGYLGGGYAASRYAVKYPERVSHLVLWPPPFTPVGTPESTALAQLAITDWENFTEVYAHLAFGWAKGEHAHAFARLMRETVTRETWLRGWGSMARRQPEEHWSHVGTITTPTLVVQRKSYASFPVVAGPIPGVTVQMVDGESAGPFVEHVEQVLDAIFAFTGAAGASPAAPAAEPAKNTGTAVILFTDIVDSTPLTERMGDAAFRTLSRSIDDRVRGAMRDHGGTPVAGKVLGDGVMGVFTSAAQAIAAALACLELGKELPMHIGLHAGDVMTEGTNVYGGAVNIASRICALCEPGEVLVSRTVADLARTSAGVTFEERGEHALKGIAEPQRVFAVQKGGE